MACWPASCPLHICQASSMHTQRPESSLCCAEAPHLVGVLLGSCVLHRLRGHRVLQVDLCQVVPRWHHVAVVDGFDERLHAEGKSEQSIIQFEQVKLRGHSLVSVNGLDEGLKDSGTISLGRCRCPTVMACSNKQVMCRRWRRY